MRMSTASGIAFASGFAFFVACSSSSQSFGTFDDAGTGADGGGSDGGIIPEDGGFFSGDALPAPILGCSPDLQYVVDEHGVVVKQCPSDQGCKAGACVPACEAAAASHG